MGDRKTNGLPGKLPDGERVLWQGAPDWRALALRAMHVRKLAIYFAVLLAWYLAAKLPQSEAPIGVMAGAIKLAGLALVPVALLSAYAWFVGRGTAYTITNRRVVMHFGVALPLSLNLPFGQIQAADVKLASDGAGDISLAVADGAGLGYVILWPHARRWHIGRAQPTLRCIPEAARVAQLLSRALAASAAVSVPAAPQLRPADALAGSHAAAAA